jgi:RecA/RadA recombinase
VKVQQATDKTAIKIEDSTNIVPAHCINTGIYILNALLGKSILTGGVQSNRITVFAGESATGKSFLCYNIAREAQKDGYTILYIDTEFAIEMQNLQNYGLDTSKEKFKLIRTNVVEDIKIFLTRLLDDIKLKMDDGFTPPKIMIILDSIGNMASRKEVEDAKEGKEKADMTRAKALASLFRIISADLGYISIPFIVTNHTYKTLDLFPQDVMKGGNGLFYAASTIVFLSKAQLKTGDEDELDLNSSGIIVTAKAKKNRLAKPKKVKFEIDFKDGCNQFVGLDWFCNEDNYASVGIAKGKVEIDKSTGEEIFKAGGNRWYCRHLGKSVPTAQLFTSKVFTEKILKALDEIIIDYFSYGSLTEIDELEKEFENELESTNGQFDMSELDL